MVDHIYAECPLDERDCAACDKYYWEYLHADLCTGKNCHCRF